MKFSILISVYNSQKTVAACLDSILSQSFSDFEIVAVNDGSTDSSLEILEQYAKKDNRIRVISQENGGISSSRNTCLRNYSGSWVIWIDADDTLCPGTLAELDALTKAESSCSTASDIVLFGNTQIPPCRTAYTPSGTTQFLDREALLDRICTPIDNNGCLSWFSVWGKAFSAELLRRSSLSFDETNPIGEDVLFMSRLYAFTDNAILLDKILYRYTINSDSLSSYGHTCEKICIARPRIFDALIETYGDRIDVPRVCVHGYFTMKVIIVNILREQGLSFKDASRYYNLGIDNANINRCVKIGAPHGFLELVIKLSRIRFFRFFAVSALWIFNKLFGHRYYAK